MFKKLYVILIALSVLCIGCNQEGDSKKTPQESTSTNATPEPGPETGPAPAPDPDPTNPTPIPNPVPTPTTSGKIVLWDRASGYDSAVFLPEDYGKDSHKLYPMILSLHGLNGSVLNVSHTAVGGQKTGFIKQVWGTALAKTYPAIVIAPNWAPAGSSGSGLWVHSQLRQLILDAKEKYQIDPDRIVVTGLSAGSIGTQDLIKNSKDLIAAAMPGAYANTFSNVCEMADIPIWVFGNNSDSLFSSSLWQSAKPKVESCGNYIHEFTLTVYNSTCGHGCWDSHWAKPEVQEWLINQRK